MEELHDLLERRCRSETWKKVMMENLPGGAMTVRMADNIKAIPSGRRKGSEDVPF